VNDPAEGEQVSQRNRRLHSSVRNAFLIGLQNEALDTNDFRTNRAQGKAKLYIQGVLVNA
jgi:hypothetical protein